MSSDPIDVEFVESCTVELIAPDDPNNDHNIPIPNNVQIKARVQLYGAKENAVYTAEVRAYYLQPGSDPLEECGAAMGEEKCPPAFPPFDPNVRNESDPIDISAWDIGWHYLKATVMEGAKPPCTCSSIPRRIVPPIGT